MGPPPFPEPLASTSLSADTLRRFTNTSRTRASSEDGSLLTTFCSDMCLHLIQGGPVSG
ncbi:hypothetical protein K439DRAFT_1643477 [Ramaria rubella]|nr:hypothetical protein K439DRAFT_1643477 [Ramaria rubella]